jgi:alanine dehydrogenase
MELTSLGVIRRSRKENEFRVPIHPAHFELIPADVGGRLIFEKGYGEPFGVSDAEIGGRFGGLAARAELLGGCDAVLLPKVVPADLEEMREGGILWGWPHCVQQMEVTRIAVQRRQTLLAFEAMFGWVDGVRGVHLFYRNNEMAGYCGVIHALSVMGLSGHYGRALKAVVLSFGAVSRGAVQALKGLGVADITVYTQRDPVEVHNKIVGCRHGRIVRQEDGQVTATQEDGSELALVEILAQADVIVNGILQDTGRPLMYVREGEERRLKRGSLIVDVSCDLGMGFPFARPTTFEEPTLRIGEVTYYAVDHTPSYLWRSASWEISQVVVAYLERVMGGPESWEQDETLKSAIEIGNGEIRNPRIISFQEGRASQSDVDQ